MDMKTLFFTFENVTVDHPGDFDPSKGITEMPNPCKGISEMPNTCIDELMNFVQKLEEPINGVPRAYLNRDHATHIPVVATLLKYNVIVRKEVYITSIEYREDHIEYVGLDLWSSGTYAAPGGVMRLYATLPEALNIIWQFVNGSTIPSNDGIYIGGPRSYSSMY